MIWNLAKVERNGGNDDNEDAHKCQEAIDFTKQVDNSGDVQEEAIIKE